MKKAAILSIIIYQSTLSVFLSQLIGAKTKCRFIPSCSEYTKTCIKKHGVIKGIKMGLVRLLHCQPLNHNYANI